jgi:hypothetical protein
MDLNPAAVLGLRLGAKIKLGVDPIRGPDPATA